MSNILSQSWLIDRRHALRALGTCISLPFLECMAPLRAAEKIATEAPTMFCVTKWGEKTDRPSYAVAAQ